MIMRKNVAIKRTIPPNAFSDQKKDLDRHFFFNLEKLL